jgi:RNA polymerase sigma-70 factor (ECF subfamily)
MISHVITRIQGGNLSAFGELYDMSYDKVYRFIYHRIGNHEQSEDIVAETYIKALKRISHFRGKHDGEFFSWIYRIAYTTLVDQTRTAHTSVDIDDVEVAYQTDEGTHIDASSKLSEVMNFLSTLSEKERTIFTMRIWDELSYAEISEITGESIANAKKIVSRTMAKIAANITYIFIFSLFLSYVSQY